MRKSYANRAANGDTRFQEVYRRILKRRGLATAKVAVAWKLLTIVYAMLKNSDTTTPLFNFYPRRYDDDSLRKQNGAVFSHDR